MVKNTWIREGFKFLMQLLGSLLICFKIQNLLSGQFLLFEYLLAFICTDYRLSKWFVFNVKILWPWTMAFFVSFIQQMHVFKTMFIRFVSLSNKMHTIFSNIQKHLNIDAKYNDLGLSDSKNINHAWCIWTLFERIWRKKICSCMNHGVEIVYMKLLFTIIGNENEFLLVMILERKISYC